MKQLIDQFDRAYIINLPTRTDRRRAVEQEFQKIGIRIPNNKVYLYPAVRPSEKGDFYSIGARGSFSSHRNVLRLAVKDRLRNVLVFEDDVAFRRLSTNVISNIVTSLPQEDWDIIYFGYLEPHEPGSKGPVTPWMHDTIGGHFYAVNGCFFETMIRYMDECERRPRDHPQGGPMSRDGAFNHIRYVIPGIRVFLAVPNLAFQRSSRSDISQAWFFERGRWPILLLEFLRRAKTQARLLSDKATSREN